MKDDYRESGTLVMPRPTGMIEKAAPSGEACLVHLHPPGPDIGRRIELVDRQYVVGRDTESGLVVGRSSVSRQHARLYQDNDQWWVVDLGSTNGTFVNGVRVTQKMLDHGVSVRIGSTEIRFLAH